MSGGDFRGSPSCEAAEFSLDGAIGLRESLTVSHFNSPLEGWIFMPRRVLEAPHAVAVGGRVSVDVLSPLGRVRLQGRRSAYADGRRP